MIQTEYNYVEGYLSANYIGEVYLNEIVEYIRNTKDNKEYPRTLKILSNAKDANMILKPEDLPVIVNENFASLEKYNYIIDAIVIDKPNEAALTILYQKLSETKKYKFKVFSTAEAAAKWLNEYTV